MGDLTPDDMARLRVRLDELPGLDPVQLKVEYEQVDPLGRARRLHALAVESPNDGHFTTFLRTGDEKFASIGRWPVAVTTVSLADAATRDRVARWWWERRALYDYHWPGSIAPAFSYDDGDEVWRLGGITVLCTRSPCDSGHLTTDLDPTDNRRLPDGSCWVDAAALAVVARHVTEAVRG